MRSLNDIVSLYVQGTRGIFKHKGISITTDFDCGMPAIYDDTAEIRPFITALSQLTLEVEDAKPSKALFETNYDILMQRLSIYHNGSPIPDDALHTLNATLGDILEGREKRHFVRHGNLIAAQAIRPYGGWIKLENLQGEEYKVKTVLSLPAFMLPQNISIKNPEEPSQ